MACKHPLVRFEYPNGDVKIMSLEKKIELDLIDLVNKKGQSPIKEQQIPCGKCIACRLNYSKNWANRLSLELKNIPENQKWFLTLTYNEENLHTTQGVDPETGEIYTSNRLDERDMQLFLKRLRKNRAEKCGHENIRYFYCGEYGSTTERAHYHIIVWNMTLDETKLKKFKVNEAHQQLWKCPEIEEIWKKGHVVAGKVSWESIAYVARYMLKKQKGQGAEEYYKLKGQTPEFCRMSTHPGIAKNYYLEHKDEIYKLDEITLAKNKGAFKIKPPRYFDKLYDLEYPEELKEIKAHREEVAKENMKLKLTKTTRTELEQLQIEENSIKQKSQKLVRPLD